MVNQSVRLLMSEKVLSGFFRYMCLCYVYYGQYCLMYIENKLNKLYLNNPLNTFSDINSLTD